MSSLAHPPIAPIPPCGTGFGELRARDEALVPRLSERAHATGATCRAAAQGDVWRANPGALIITSQLNPDGKAVARPGGGPGLEVHPAPRPAAAY